MQTFKRVLCSFLIFSVTFLSISAAFMVPYLNSESVYYQDSKLRRSLAGTLDCIVLGASQGSCAFVPEVLDSNLGVNSYNLSSALIPIHARKYLLEKELNRNNIKTVIIELSYNTLARNSTAEFGNGDTRVIEKLDSAQERIKYMLKYIKFNDWINVYSHLFMNSLNGIETFITDGGNNVDYKAKGFDSRKVSVGSINPKEVIKTYNTEKISTNYYENNVKVLTDIIDTCKTKNIRVIIAVAPLSDVLLWKYKNMDDFLSWATNYSNQQSCEFYDFNLIKSRYELFSNNSLWRSDFSHMAPEGAMAFSSQFADIIKKVNSGKDISDFFYSSYEDMKKDSPYMNLLNSD